MSTPTAPPTFNSAYSNLATRLHGKVDPALFEVVRVMNDNISTLGQQIQTTFGAIPTNQQITKLAQDVVNGTANDITNATGQAGQPQLALIPPVGSLPDAYNGEVVWFQGRAWRFNGATWQPLVGSPNLAGTAAGMPSAATYPLFTIYYQTDRTVFYMNTSGTFTYVSGVMVAATASRPTGLGASGTGFLFLDSTLNILERWSGSAWVTILTGFIAPGAWTTYSPTLTPSAGTATISYSNCRYSKSGKDVVVRGHLTFTVSLTATNAVIELPATALDNDQTVTATLLSSVPASIVCPCYFNSGIEVIASLAASVTYDLYFQGAYESS